MHEDIDLIVDYMDKRIEELNKLREDLKAQYDDLFPSTGKDGAEFNLSG
jgi:prefoldin subunit 5